MPDKKPKASKDPYPKELKNTAFYNPKTKSVQSGYTEVSKIYPKGNAGNADTILREIYRNKPKGLFEKKYKTR